MIPMQVNDSSSFKGVKGIATILIVVAVAIIAFVIIKKIKDLGTGILEGVNLKDTEAEKKDKATVEKKTTKAVSEGVKSAWSPAFYNTPTAQKNKAKLFTVETVKKLVSTIWNSVGYFKDTPSLFAGAIKQCSTKSQVSWIAYNFQKTHGVDLLSWAKNKFDTNEQKEILADVLEYVENLPSYK